MIRNILRYIITPSSAISVSNTSSLCLSVRIYIYVWIESVGATWELAGSAFLAFGPLASLLSGHSMNDGLAETIPYLKAGFACVYLFAAIAKLNKGMC